MFKKIIVLVLSFMLIGSCSLFNSAFACQVNSKTNTSITTQSFVKLLSNGYGTVYNITYSLSGKEFKINGKTYMHLSDKYNSIDKIKKVMKPYFTDNYIKYYIKAAGITKVDNKLCILAGDLGIGYNYKTIKITNKKIDNKKAHICYSVIRGSEKEAEDIFLAYVNGKWKIETWKYAI